MANPEHVKVVQKGAASIRKWRRKNPKQNFNLIEANLSGANLKYAWLFRANLSRANLSNADLFQAELILADLSHAKLNGADMWGTKLIKANLSSADLSGSTGDITDFTGANLSKSDLTKAVLLLANLTTADLSEADLSDAYLFGVNFSDTILHKANFTDVNMGLATIGHCDLSQCVGLENVKHGSPSSICVDTLIQSFRGAGNRFTSELELFFLNAGVPKQLLDVLPEILADVQYCSCFVCYGQPDLGFAEKLVKDLKAKGVSCWLYSMDYTPGEKVWREIIQKRREAEKMIVLCSAQSLVRDGVLKEIEEQIDEDPDKIVPISRDNIWKHNGFLVKRGQRDLKPFLLERNYADFCDEPTYKDSLRRLLRGIKRA